MALKVFQPNCGKNKNKQRSPNSAFGADFTPSTPLASAGLSWDKLVHPFKPLAGLTQINRAAGACPFDLAVGKQKCPGNL